MFVISTEEDIVAYAGENYFTMQVKFDNSAQPTTQGNWPRGTCSGPYSIGIVSYTLTIRQPEFCICKNKGADQLRSNCEADQHLCFRYMDITLYVHVLSKS